jgi:tRNA pseudouridine55 synthase
MHCGIVLLDKPVGLSSNAALQRVRSLFGRVKAGHVGALDPLASGMLPICLGEATKVAAEIISARKRYRFTVALGVRTASGDAEGAVIEERAVPALEAAAIESVLRAFIGPRAQVPPMYSALKHAGQPLYRLARSGVTVERVARAIELFALELVQHTDAAIELQVLCSKGTYVRVLGEELAAALGTVGHLAALRRLYVEPFADEPMYTLEALAADPPAALLPADWPLRSLPEVRLAAADAARVRHGQAVQCGADACRARVRIYDEWQRFLGLGETDGTGTLQPRRLLNLS